MSAECPLCLNEFSGADVIYPLKCRTPTCEFNYCSECIENLRKSASDGYQEASDGSRQVKIQLKCPQCREKYQCKAYSSTIVIGSVLILREAASIQDTILQQTDSQLSATQLGRKHSFLLSTSMEQLQDAARRLQVYQEEIDKAENPVPALDWEAWRPLVRETLPPAHNSSSTQNQSAGGQNESSSHHYAPPVWCDPTLFYGLDELMTLDEQEFVTSLLTSGHTESLMQAAQILHGILDMATSRTVAAKKQQQQQQRVVVNTNKPCIKPQKMLKIRKKYPLPPRMPQCIKLPVYNPEQQKGPFTFEGKRMTCLVLSGVTGPAGRSGLRRGDMVTHVNGDVVQTMAEYNQALMQEAASNATEFWLTVNADMEISHELHKRAKQMQADKVYFY